MFVKYLISSIESLYMQMIRTNYINNNIPGFKICLGSLPGIHGAANNSQYAALDEFVGKCQRSRRKPERGGSEEGRTAKRAGAPTLQHADGAQSGVRRSPEPRGTPGSWGTSRPARHGLVQSRQVAMQQAGTVCLEKSFCLCNAAVHQHLSKSPAPVLGSSSLSIYPPIVSANNGALHIYSIFHLRAGDKAVMRAGSTRKGHRTRVPNPGSCPRGCPRVGLAPDPAPAPSAWAPSQSADAARGVPAAPTRMEAAVRGHGRFTNEVLTPPGSSRP